METENTTLDNVVMFLGVPILTYSGDEINGTTFVQYTNCEFTLPELEKYNGMSCSVKHDGQLIILDGESSGSPYAYITDIPSFRTILQTKWN